MGHSTEWAKIYLSIPLKRKQLKIYFIMLMVVKLWTGTTLKVVNFLWDLLIHLVFYNFNFSVIHFFPLLSSMVLLIIYYSVSLCEEYRFAVLYLWLSSQWRFMCFYSFWKAIFPISLFLLLHAKTTIRWKYSFLKKTEIWRNKLPKNHIFW